MLKFKLILNSGRSYNVTIVNFSNIKTEEKTEIQTPVSATEAQLIKQITKKYQKASSSHVAPTWLQDRNISVTLWACFCMRVTYSCE